MSTSELEILVELRDLASKQFKSMSDQIERTAKKTDDIGRSLGGLGGSARKGVGDLSDQFAIGSIKADMITAAVNALATAIDLAAQAAVALTAATADFIKQGVQYNASIESSTAIINAFTGSQEATAEIMDMLQRRAATSVFTFQQMSQAAQGLIPAATMSGASLETLMETAEALGASNPAEGIEGAAFALREAVSGDFTSVIERFNLPRQRLNQLKEQGVPALEAVQTAMFELGIDMDLVTAQSQTMNGRMDRAAEIFDTLAGIISKPIFNKISEGLEDILAWYDENPELFDNIKTGVSDIEMVIGETADAAARGEDPFLAMADSLLLIDEYSDGSNEGLQTMAEILQNLSKALAPINTAMAPLMPLFNIFADVAIQTGVALIVNEINKMVGAAAVFGAMGQGLSLFQAAQKATDQALRTELLKGIAEAQRMFGEFGDDMRILGERAYAHLLEPFSRLGITLPTTTRGAFAAAQRSIETFNLDGTSAANDLITSTKEQLEDTTDGLKAEIMKAWDDAQIAVNEFVLSAREAINTFIGSVKGWLEDTSRGLTQAFTSAFDDTQDDIDLITMDGTAVANSLITSIGVVLTGPAGIAFVVANAMTGAQNTIGTDPKTKLTSSGSGKSIVDSIWNWLSGGATGLSKWIGDSFANTQRWLGNQILNAPNAAKGIVDSIWNWLSGAATGTSKWIGDSFTNTQRWLNNQILKAGPVAKSIVDSIWNWLSGAATGTSKWIGTSFTNTQKWLNDQILKAGPVAKSIVDSIWKWLSSAATGTSKWIGDSFTNTQKWLNDQILKAGPVAKSIVDSIYNWLVNATNGTNKWLGDAFTSTQTWLTNKTLSAVEIAKSIIKSLYNWLTGSTSGNKSLNKETGTAFDGLGTWLSNRKQDAGPVAKAIVASLLATLIGPVGLIAVAAIPAFNSLGTWLAGRKQEETKPGTSIVDTLKTTLDDAATGLRNGAKTAFDNLSTWLGSRTESGKPVGESITKSTKDALDKSDTGLTAKVQAAFTAMGDWLKNTFSVDANFIANVKAVGEGIVAGIDASLKSVTAAKPGLIMIIRDRFEALRLYMAGTIRTSMTAQTYALGQDLMIDLARGINLNGAAVYGALTKPVVDAINYNRRLQNPSAPLIPYPTWQGPSTLPARPAPVSPIPVPTAGTPRSATTTGTTTEPTIVINIGSVRDARDIDSIRNAVRDGMNEAARRGIVQSQLPRGI